MYAARVNETTVTEGNFYFIFIFELFALGGEKNENMTKKTFFWGSSQSYFMTFQRRVFVFFWTILVLAIFWPLPVPFKYYY